MSYGPFKVGDTVRFTSGGTPFLVTIRLRMEIKPKRGRWVPAYLVVSQRGAEFLAGEGELVAAG